MKIAFTGKGGVGKTTLAACLALHYAASGKNVFAVDADPDANLASALGVDGGSISSITPISEMKDLVQERTGAQPGSFGGFFKLNPKVSDLPERLAIPVKGVRLMVMGGVDHAGTGCVCPESALLRNLLRHLVLERNDVVVMDMEAGIEHLGRSTAEAVDAFVIVVEPGMRSIQTAKTVARLASEIGVKHAFLIINKLRDPEEEAILTSQLPDTTLLGVIPDSDAIRRADLTGVPPFEADPGLASNVSDLAKKLEAVLMLS